MPDQLTDKAIKSYATSLAKVMGELEAEVLSFMAGIGGTTPAAASTLINSRPEFLKFLRDSGYNQLSSDYVNRYSEIPETVKKAYAARKLPAPKFTTVSQETFAGLARMDLQAFSAIGTKAMDDLRLGIYRQVISVQNFKDIVQTVKAATTGVSKKGSPLANYSYTHANTAILTFQGEVIQEAGESIGFGSDDSLWEAEGPLDDATRDICQEALSNPVRTKGEWIDFGYFGGAPGGFNCRHVLYPYFG